MAGVPGSGKSTLAARLTRSLSLRYIGLAELVLESGAWSSYDPMRRTFYIDVYSLTSTLRSVVRGDGRVLIEATELETIWEAGLEPFAVIILRCNPLKLYDRLKERGWPVQKLIENIEAEIVGVVAWQGLSLFGEKRVCEIDTSKRSPEEVYSVAMKFIIRRDRSVCDEVDWTLVDEVVTFISKLGNKLV